MLKNRLLAVLRMTTGKPHSSQTFSVRREFQAVNPTPCLNASALCPFGIHSLATISSNRSPLALAKNVQGKTKLLKSIASSYFLHDSKLAGRQAGSSMHALSVSIARLVSFRPGSLWLAGSHRLTVRRRLNIHMPEKPWRFLVPTSAWKGP